MHLGLLFYSDSLVLQNQTQKLNGRGMANIGFLSALLKYKKEHELTIIVSADWEKQVLQEHIPELKLHHCPLVSLSELKNYLQQKPLHALHYPSPDLYRAFEIKKLNPIPLAITGVTHSLGNSPFLEWLYLTLLAKPNSKDALVCTSSAAVEVLRKMQNGIQESCGLASIATPKIPLAIDCSHFETATTNNLETEFAADEFLLLYVGRLSLSSKCDLKPLLLVFRELIKRSPKKIRLVVAGACDEEGYLNDLMAYSESLGIAQQVSFQKNPSEEFKKNLLKRAQIFVAPNDNPQETFGLSILEALASGLPVIAADWNGYKDLIQNEKEGFLIPTLIPPQIDFMAETAALQIDAMNHLYFSQSTATDLEIFIDKILLLLNNENLRLQMSEAAKQKSRIYDWKQIIPQYLNLWKRLSEKSEQNELTPLSVSTTSTSKLYTLNYHEIFSHYATEILNEKHQFQLSDLGKEALEGSIPLENSPSLDQFLPVQDVLQILQMGLKGFRLADLVSIANAEFILLWLYKYGFLKRG